MYTHDPYTPARNNSTEEVVRLRNQVEQLKKENATLKSRLRGEHQLFGGKQGGYGGQQGSYNSPRGGARGRGGQGGQASNNNFSGRLTYQYMSLEEKKAATCSDWN